MKETRLLAPPAEGLLTVANVMGVKLYYLKCIIKVVRFFFLLFSFLFDNLPPPPPP